MEDLYLYMGIISILVILGTSVFMPKIKGVLGEKSVALILSYLNTKKYRVINDLMIKNGKKTSQIDHVIVSNYGIFVIETKNYKGLIVGKEEDLYWNQILYKKKEKMYNPVKQNYGHIKALKETLKDFENLKFISIVVFDPKAELRVRCKTEVVYLPKLLKTINKYKSRCIDERTKQKIYLKLKGSHVKGRQIRKEHVNYINKNIKKRSVIR